MPGSSHLEGGGRRREGQRAEAGVQAGVAGWCAVVGESEARRGASFFRCWNGVSETETAVWFVRGS